jgi:hypothetical protein
VVWLLAPTRRIGRDSAVRPPMRVLATAAVLGLGVVTASLSAPLQARACTGPSIEFADAVRSSQGSIYAGRITDVARARTGYSTVTMTVQIVVRGPARETLSRVLPPFVCDSIDEGQWGYMVRDIRHPDYIDGTADVFFGIGNSVARPILRAAGLPDTGTAIEEPSRARSKDAVAVVVAVTLTAYVAIYGLIRVRPTSGRPAGGTGRSTTPRPRSHS